MILMRTLHSMYHKAFLYEQSFDFLMISAFVSPKDDYRLFLRPALAPLPKGVTLSPDIIRLVHSYIYSYMFPPSL